MARGDDILNLPNFIPHPRANDGSITSSTKGTSINTGSMKMRERSRRFKEKYRSKPSDWKAKHNSTRDALEKKIKRERIAKRLSEPAVQDEVFQNYSAGSAWRGNGSDR